MMVAGIFLLKASALLALATAVISLLRKAEPRWRVLTARAAVIALPLLFFAGWLGPVFFEPIEYAFPRSETIGLPQKTPLATESSQIDASLFPTLLPVEIEPISFPQNLVESLSLFELLVYAAVMLWGLVALVLLSREIFCFAVLKNSHSKEKNPVSFRLSILWQMACEDNHLSENNIPSLINSGTENYSPFLLPGIWRNRLVYPSCFEEHFGRETVLHVFRHEAAHIATGDVRWIPAMHLLRCMFWFHPLIWILAAQHLRACEEAADATAARLGGIESYRSALAELALELLPVRQATAAAFIRVPSVVKRLRVIPSHAELRPPTRLRGLLMALMVLAAGFAIGNVSFAEKVRSLEMARIERETLELQKRINLESQALEGLTLYSQGMLLIQSERLEEAVDKFFEALETLPETEESQSRRDLVLHQLNLSATELAQKYLREGEDGKATVLGLRFSKYQREIEMKRARTMPDVDPGNLWYRGYLLVQKAEKLEEEGKYLEASNKLKEALAFYLQLRKHFPKFHQDIVQDRLRLMSEKRAELRQLLRERP